MLRVGLIGAGLIGAKRSAALTEGMVLVGIHDVKMSAATALAEKHSVESHEDLESLIDIVGAGGLVIIATPHNLLAGLALKALSQGCHVLVEKPGALNHKELEEVNSMAKKNNLVLRVGYNHRFHPSISEIRDVVRSREFGAVKLIRGRYGHGGRLGYEKEWRADKKISGGGELIDQGSHLLDLSRYILGDLNLEFASTPTVYWEMEVEDNAFMFLNSSSGAKVWLHASWTEWKNLFSFEVFFENAKLEAKGLGSSYGTETLVTHIMEGGLGIPIQNDKVFEGPDLSWHHELLDVEAEILTTGDVKGANGESSLEVLRIVDGAYRFDNH